MAHWAAAASSGVDGPLVADASAVPPALVRDSTKRASSSSVRSLVHSSRACSSSAPGAVRKRSATRWEGGGLVDSRTPVVADGAFFPSASSCSQCRRTVLRCTSRVRANASIDDSNRCCKPTTSKPAAARCLAVARAWRSSRAVRYSSSSCDSTISGASAGSPSTLMRTMLRFGKPPCTKRTSSLSRRTITSSNTPLPWILTPRVKRYGSSSSSNVEKLLEWPLWGVAERNNRCSNRSDRSRTARVNLVSMP